MSGVDRIAAERQRQMESEGWTPDHDDDHHDTGQLAWAAVCYAAPETVYRQYERGDGVTFAEPWPLYLGSARGEPAYLPWRRSGGDRIAQLVKAGALIAAEIDRLERAGGDHADRH